jgi:hypothetical protein
MFKSAVLTLVPLACAFVAGASPTTHQSAPLVTLDQGIFTGSLSYSGHSAQFLTIPFAQPP